MPGETRSDADRALGRFDLVGGGTTISNGRRRIGGRMQIGVVFPQTELGGDVGAVRAYVRRVEELGYRHVLAYDHVVGADPAVHSGWSGPYDVTTTFHEPFVLFGYMAGVSSLELVTGIIILPQRQTALVAKQAAEVDLLSGGRFRLGIGLGWNAVEYEALGQDFSSRGRRAEEQVDLLRRLWTEPSVTYEGRFDRVTGAGLAPLPVQRPIPIWFGAQSERAYRRAGGLGDGWFPQGTPGPPRGGARGAGGGAGRRLVPASPAGPAAGRGARRVRAGGPGGGPRPGGHRHGGPGLLAWRSRAGGRAGREVAGRGGHPPVGQHHGRRAARPRGAPRRAGGGRRGPEVSWRVGRGGRGRWPVRARGGRPGPGGSAAGPVQTEDQLRIAGLERAGELRAVADLPGAGEQRPPDLKLPLLPHGQRGRDVPAGRDQLVGQGPAVVRRLGGARRGVRPHRECRVTDKADPPERHPRPLDVVDRLHERLRHAGHNLGDGRGKHVGGRLPHAGNGPVGRGAGRQRQRAADAVPGGHQL